jgi:hypothetical protein
LVGDDFFRRIEERETVGFVEVVIVVVFVGDWRLLFVVVVLVDLRLLLLDLIVFSVYSFEVVGTGI